MNEERIIKHLNEIGDEQRLEKMKRFGIDTSTAIGISVSELRKYARTIRKNHSLALNLWKTNIHEARMLAVLLDEPRKVTEEQMETWAMDFNSWDLCDYYCSNLFDKTTFARKKINEWSKRNKECVKRAAFSLIAALATHDKKASNESFEVFFPIILRESSDERKYVKKAVNWSLRNIGKRNRFLNKRAIEIAEKMIEKKNKTSRWIATDAINELTSQKIQDRLAKEPSKN